ncbi:endodeoxyribonuclease [Malassezia sp. CBS 17886]|nr:endodeoxyribonuclease [Malassezia sp. CBS 17886]
MAQGAQLFGVLRYMHSALADGITLTKRDIYYRDPPLFGSARTVDALVDRIALTLDCPRPSLGVCATPRGVYSGAIHIALHAQPPHTQAGDAPPALTLAAPDESAIRTISVPARWVLVVEKYAVFQTLQSMRFLDRSAAHGIAGRGALITGKGYPDVATRALLCALLRCSKSVHIFFLVDANPHGLDILRTYCDALQGMPSAIAARTHWIGLRTREWMQVPAAIPLPLSRVDRRMAQRLLQRTELPAAWRAEVAAQLHVGYKCELEVLCEEPGKG